MLCQSESVCDWSDSNNEKAESDEVDDEDDGSLSLTVITSAVVSCTLQRLLFLSMHFSLYNSNFISLRLAPNFKQT